MADDGITEEQGRQIIRLLDHILDQLKDTQVNTYKTEARLASIERDVSSIEMQIGS
jgi:hypothetical protein